jgi:hypothetical protein
MMRVAVNDLLRFKDVACLLEKAKKLRESFRAEIMAVFVG